ncbi:MAG: 1-deoxy-D-xylulose-5-phosphate synthase [Lachnospiraceae bacterium]|nr:1-deoxy-D-xylulose-5-phosphate synthase [Lachnospiraceae bacterium]
MVLEKISKPNDIQKIPLEEFPLLAEEIRQFLVESLSKTGGHLASNLGVVELTMALHNVFHLPEDKLIWDVGHQSYTHKILTGRKDGFADLRKLGGMSGFPKRSESDCDVFDTGHSTTSISAGIGYVKARDLLCQDYHVVSIIGDGSLTGGMAYEAMNNAAELKTNFIIVLNDNKMSISENVGGISQYLGNVRTAEAYTGLKMGVTNGLNKIPVIGKKTVAALRRTKRSIKQLMIPGMLFEDIGLTYLGPVDGHNLRQMMRVFNEAKRVEGPVLVHVVTEKGRGYVPAVRHPARFHGTAPFEIETGLPAQHTGKANYTDIFSTVMRKFGDRYDRVVAVSAAMPDGTGLKRFRNMFPERFYDVGMAEEHAVTFAAGLALGGLVPVVAIYSSFLQRSFDQIMHDVCMQNLHVIFAVDRAGLVGSDGETHQGAFDLSYLSVMPNMTILAPKNKWELSDMMKYAVKHLGPIAIRYPRGEAYDGLEEFRAPVEYRKSEMLYEGSQVALLAVGAMVKEGEKVCERLKEFGIQATLVNVRFVKPLDGELIQRLASTHTLLVTMEDNVRTGGYGNQVISYLNEMRLNCRVLQIAIPDVFVEHGNVERLHEQLHMDAESIVQKINEELA